MGTKITFLHQIYIRGVILQSSILSCSASCLQLNQQLRKNIKKVASTSLGYLPHQQTLVIYILSER